MEKKKILFIDRDGTLIREPADEQVDDLSKLEFVPGVIGALSRIAATTDYRLVMVSNQDGLGTDSFPEQTFWPAHRAMLRTFEGEGVRFDQVLIDRSFPQDNAPGRKPRTGMVTGYLNELLDYDNSYVIGDRRTDMELAVNMGVKGLYLGREEDVRDIPQARAVEAWGQIAGILLRGDRRVSLRRTTSETDIRITLDLNGTGRGEIETGIGFFDHMLDQIARHGGVDLAIRAKGDLHVDQHHTIEDTAILLGECFARALGSKKGVERYGYCLPMDEARAEVLLDFGGRYALAWDVELAREYVGDFPTEMTRHFFDAFAQSARANLHVRARGENTHHVIEAVFKAVARAIRTAVARDERGGIPSSKGVL